MARWSLVDLISASGLLLRRLGSLSEPMATRLYAIKVEELLEVSVC